MEKSRRERIVEILGHVNDPGTDILSIVRGYDLPTEFPEKIMNQVERVAGEVSTADMAGRMDLRDWQTVTIDGEDAKDLDDAITLTKEGDVYRLGVHIADVTNYVQERSALDVEALKRGHIGLSCRPCDPDASACAFQRYLFAERRGEPAGIKLYHDRGCEGKCDRSRDCGDSH